MLELTDESIFRAPGVSSLACARAGLVVKSLGMGPRQVVPHRCHCCVSRTLWHEDSMWSWARCGVHGKGLSRYSDLGIESMPATAKADADDRGTRRSSTLRSQEYIDIYGGLFARGHRLTPCTICGASLTGATMNLFHCGSVHVHQRHPLRIDPVKS